LFRRRRPPFRRPPSAARIAAEEDPGEVLVSTVKDLVAGSEIAFRHLGARELKGVRGSWNPYAVDS